MPLQVRETFSGRLRVSQAGGTFVRAKRLIPPGGRFAGIEKVGGVSIRGGGKKASESRNTHVVRR